MPSRTILDCCPELQKAWPKVLKFLANKHKHYRLQIVETHVTPEEQKDRFNLGRNGLGEVVNYDHTVTDFDGTIVMSLQNYYPSQALRFRILNEDGKELYTEGAIMALQQIADDLHIGYTIPNFFYTPPPTRK